MTEITSWDAVEVRFSEVAEGQNHIRQHITKLEGAVSDLHEQFQGFAELLKEIQESQIRIETQRNRSSSTPAIVIGATSTTEAITVTASISETPKGFFEKSISDKVISVELEPASLLIQVSEGLTKLCDSVAIRSPKELAEYELQQQLQPVTIMEVYPNCSIPTTFTGNSIPKLYGSISYKFMYATLSVMYPWCFDLGILSCSIIRKCHRRNGYAVNVMFDEMISDVWMNDYIISALHTNDFPKWIASEFLFAKFQCGFGIFTEPTAGFMVITSISVIYKVCFDPGISLSIRTPFEGNHQFRGILIVKEGSCTMHIICFLNVISIVSVNKGMAVFARVQLLIMPVAKNCLILLLIVLDRADIMLTGMCIAIGNDCARCRDSTTAEGVVNTDTAIMIIQAYNCGHSVFWALDQGIRGNLLDHSRL